MKTHDIDQLLHVIKPDGHGANPLATELHRLACALQEQTDKVHAALVGKFHPWQGHFPLQLDHEEGRLIDIMVSGLSVSEHLAAGLWEEAEAYVQERFGPEMLPGARKIVARMDAADLRSERAA